MTNKIEPVSKAAAKYFATQCIGMDNKDNVINLPLFSLFYVHGVNAVQEIDYIQFGQFCRAVADQLDPVEVVEPGLLEDYHQRNLTKNVFRAGYHRSLDDLRAGRISFAEIADHDCDIRDKEIEEQLEKQGLLGKDDE